MRVLHTRPDLFAVGVLAEVAAGWPSAVTEDLGRETAAVDSSGKFDVAIAASDIGTGARTAIRLMAADALGVAPEDIDLRIGDSAMGEAMIAGGSMGTASWGWAVDKACRLLHARMESATPTSSMSTRPGSRRTSATSVRSGSRASARSAIVGTSAAIANAVHHATGTRIRDLPIRLDKLLGSREPHRTTTKEE